MVNLGEPFTFENSSNPWLMDRKDDSDVLVLNGEKLTAAYLWTLNAEERKSVLKCVFQHYRDSGFPKLKLTDSKLKSEFAKLCRLEESSL